MAVDQTSREIRKVMDYIIIGLKGTFNQKYWDGIRLATKRWGFLLLLGCFEITMCASNCCTWRTARVTLTNYMVSPAVVKVLNTEWSEKALVQLSINLPTGSTIYTQNPHLSWWKVAIGTHFVILHGWWKMPEKGWSYGCQCRSSTWSSQRAS